MAQEIYLFYGIILLCYLKKAGVKVIDRKDLYGSIKLSGETVFHHNISQDKDKLDI